MRLRFYVFLGLASLGFIVSACAIHQPPKSYSTPENTFRTWKYAAEKMDIQTLLESYANSARPSVEEDLAKSSHEALAQMQKETKKTNFEIQKIVYENDLAYLRILRKKGRVAEVEVVTMIKEGNNWKLLP